MYFGNYRALYQVAPDPSLYLERQRKIQENCLYEKRRYLHALLAERTALVRCVQLIPYMLIPVEHFAAEQQHSTNATSATEPGACLWLPAEVCAIIGRLVIAVTFRWVQ
jgi:hypothetical protein